MTNLEKIINVIMASSVEGASAITINEQTELSMTQIAEATRPAIKNGTMTKEGVGRKAIYFIVKVEEEFTDNEFNMLAAFYQESVNVCGACNEDENMSYLNADDLLKELGGSAQSIGGTMASLLSKGAIADWGDSPRGASINDFVIESTVAVKYAHRLSTHKIVKQPVEQADEPSQDEQITLKDLCEQHKINAMKARSRLRKANFAKPGKQWIWSNDVNVDEILKVIKSC